MRRTLVPALGISILLSIPSFSQNNNLAAGDIAIVSYQSDPDLTNMSMGGTTNFSDRFSIVILRNGGIPAGTIIYFTDNGWNSFSNNFITQGEGFISWEVSASGVMQGTEIYFISTSIGPATTWNAYTSEAGTTTIGTTISNLNGNIMELAPSGDQVLIFQTGPTGGPAGGFNNATRRFITALHANNESAITNYATWDGNNPITGNQSNIPPGLTNGTTAFLMSPGPLPGASDGTTEPDNGKYNCSNSNSIGNALLLSTIIYTTANWTFQSAPFTIGSTSNDCLYSSSESLLPVNLISFSAQSSGDHIRLRWQTDEEINNDYFEPERSIDGRNYVVMTRVAGTNGSGVQNYEWIDATARSSHSSKLLYRLKIVSLTGEEEYSNTVIVRPDKSGNLINSVQPNPFKDKLDISLNMPSGGKLTLILTDITGRMLCKEFIQASKGFSTYLLKDLERLLPGLYFISADFEGQVVMVKVVKE